MLCHKYSSYLWQNFVAVGKGFLSNRGAKKVPHKKWLFYRYWLVEREKKLQISTGMLPIITSISDKFLWVSISMTLNDLEARKKGVLVNFLRFWTAMHMSRVNCAEMAADRRRQPANRNCQRCRASHELCSNYLFSMLFRFRVISLYRTDKRTSELSIKTDCRNITVLTRK